MGINLSLDNQNTSLRPFGSASMPSMALSQSASVASYWRPELSDNAMLGVQAEPIGRKTKKPLVHHMPEVTSYK